MAVGVMQAKTVVDPMLPQPEVVKSLRVAKEVLMKVVDTFTVSPLPHETTSGKTPTVSKRSAVFIQFPPVESGMAKL